MSTCLFCKIITEKLNLLYEDDKTAVLIDIRPIEKGHLLVLPKAHFSNFLETPLSLVTAVQNTSQKCLKILQQAYPQIKGFNVITNIGSEALQTIFHYHQHLIPKFLPNHGFSYSGSIREPDAEDFDTLKRTLQELLKNH